MNSLVGILEAGWVRRVPQGVEAGDGVHVGQECAESAMQGNGCRGRFGTGGEGSGIDGETRIVEFETTIGTAAGGRGIAVVGNTVGECRSGIGASHAAGTFIAHNLVHDIERSGIVTDLDQVTIEGNVLRNCGKDAAWCPGQLGGGRASIRVCNGALCTVRDNQIFDYQGVPTVQYAIAVADNGHVVEGNRGQGMTAAPIFWATGATNRARGKPGFATEADGTATIASGATTVVVTHGLARTPAPSDILVTPTNTLGNAAESWISTPTSTQFTLNVNADPGARTATFPWRAELSP